MKYAKDFRRVARNALSGKWGTAVVAGLIASLLGAISWDVSEFELNFREGYFDEGLQLFEQNVGGATEFWPVIAGVATSAAVFAVVIGIGLFVIGSIVNVGYMKFNLGLVDGQQETKISTMFSYFQFWKTTTGARLLQGVYIFLWSLLFIIPGIIAGYSYAMTSYILAEDPELTASEAIKRSKQMMYGNRMRLFCLQISFLGWELLSIFLTFGIGSLWIIPYKQAAVAAFYREISGTEHNGYAQSERRTAE